MHASRLGLVAILTLACAPPKERPDGQFVQQGRLYTSWLYGNEYNKLWARFSPEMRQTFGSVGELASFAGQAFTHLGTERRVVDESVMEADPFLVYTRAASFNKAQHPILIEWSLARDGEVTGLVVRPAPTDSAKQ
ncbi:MAG: hypothetical protein H0X07_01420 [Gemmatimonadales bacterium]|nr:hypothetical protein [Gemmatimonadales bacterium]